MSVILYDGTQLPGFDSELALQDLLDSARRSDFKEEAGKLALCVTGGYGRTLELTSQHWVDRFNASLKRLLRANSITLKAAPAGSQALYPGRAA